MISMSGDSTKDCSAIVGVLPPLYLIFKYIKFQKKSRICLCASSYQKLIYKHVLMFTFIANLYSKITTKTLTNTHADKKKVY